MVTTASDADSAGDGKFVAHSISGEDDFVDVSMLDAPNATAQEKSEAGSKSKYVT